MVPRPTHSLAIMPSRSDRLTSIPKPTKVAAAHRCVDHNAQAVTNQNCHQQTYHPPHINIQFFTPQTRESCAIVGRQSSLGRRLMFSRLSFKALLVSALLVRARYHLLHCRWRHCRGSRHALVGRGTPRRRILGHRAPREHQARGSLW